MSSFNWPVNSTTVTATNPSVSNTGSAVPSQATMVGGTDGTNLKAISVTSTGVVNVSASGGGIVPVSGTVYQGSPPWSVSQSGTWTVQPGNTANTTPWLATISQGGNSATVSAGGALKVDSSAAVQPVSGLVYQGTSPWVNNITQVGGSSLALGQTTMSASVPVALASNQSTVTTKQAASTAGTIRQAALTVGTSAVRLTTDGSAPPSTRVMLSFTPDSGSSAAFYFGSSGVTSSGGSRGVRVQPGQIGTANYDPGDYYIISDTAAQTVYVTEQI